MERQPNTQYILSLSYGKDSLACLEAVKQLNYPLDRIVHAEIWATDTIHADLPPMVEFKSKADEIIHERYGYEVEHYCASRQGEKMTYEKMFYHIPKRKQRERERRFNQGIPISMQQLLQEAQVIRPAPRQSTDFQCVVALGATAPSKEPPLGFPMLRGQWCNSSLKAPLFQ